MCVIAFPCVLEISEANSSLHILNALVETRESTRNYINIYSYYIAILFSYFLLLLLAFILRIY
jgi:hypothetical protein